jgi:AraC-like DNA-binding protein
MHDRNPTRLSLVHMLPDIAAAHGVAIAPLLASAGIVADEAVLDDRVVARAQICALLNNLARRAGVPTIGIDLAAAADPQRLGLSGIAMLSGRTLRECMIAHARHMPGLQGGVQMVLREQQGRAFWLHRMEDSEPATARVLYEGIAAFVVAAVRAVLGEQHAPMHVTLPHRPIVPALQYEEKLKTAVSFQPGQGIVISFDATLLDRPNVLLPAISGWSPDPEAAAVRPVSEEESALSDNELLLSLQSIIEAAALSGMLSLRNAAATLGLSPRGLQRRLAAMGTAFEVLIDDWRRNTATASLSDPALRVATVSGRLGYADTAHFIRAFHRWEGMSPTAFRATRIAGRTG